MEKAYISITEANKNFSKVARLCNEAKEVIILDNNKMEISDDEKIEIASKRVLKRFHKAFEELAK